MRGGLEAKAGFCCGVSSCFKGETLSTFPGRFAISCTPEVEIEITTLSFTFVTGFWDLVGRVPASTESILLLVKDRLFLKIKGQSIFVTLHFVVQYMHATYNLNPQILTSQK